jgi:hypothetical protein
MVAYTKRAYSSTRGNRGNNARYPLQSRTNKPVKRIYKKRPATTKTGRNKSAIMTISRQVRTLQNQRAGEIQSHTQWCNLTGTNTPTSSRPICFGLNNFYDQEIYKGQVTSGVATYAVATNFQRHIYDSDLLDQYEWNARRNTALVSTVEYKPVYTKLNFELNFNASQATYPSRVRITLLKVKPFIASTKLNVSLPAALGAYRFLANGGSTYQNFFDKTYHTILQDKWINIRPPANSALTEFAKYVRMDYRYDSTILKPDITSTPSGQNFWTNTNVKDQIWVLISTDAGDFLDNVRINKFDVWRDPHGV